MQLYLSHLCNAFVLSALLVPLLSRQAYRIGLVDSPNARKSHLGKVPLVGGLAMFAAVILTSLTLDGVMTRYSVFFFALTILVSVGVADDAIDLHAGIKGLAQAAGALIMTLWGGLIVVNLGAILGPQAVSIPNTGVPFTIICVIGLINALNMMDGEDGLAGGITLTALFWLLIASWLGGAHSSALVISIFAAALSGFLIYNLRNPWRERAAAFMGDAGSMMLGFALAWFAVDLSQGERPALTPVTILWIFALPAIDATLVILHRLAHRRSPFAPGVDHLHHALRRRGFSVQKTVAIMVGGSCLTGALGMGGFWLGLPEWLMFALFVLLVGIYAVTVSHLRASGDGSVAASQARPERRRPRTRYSLRRHALIREEAPVFAFLKKPHHDSKAQN